MSYVVAIDVGTSSCRAVLFTEDLREVASSSKEYDIFSPRPGFAEQDPEELLGATMQVIGDVISSSGVDKSEIKALSWAAVMHSFIALDKGKRPLTNAWIWADLRSTIYADKLREKGDFFYQKSGCPIHPMYWPAKITCLKTEYPQIWQQTAHLVSLKEYMIYRLSGQLVSDKSIAAATGILNIHNLEWDQDILNELGVDRQVLSPAVEPVYAVEGLLPEIADQLGLLPTTPIVVGSSDGTLSNLGSGAVTPGVMALMVGTSGAIRVVTDKPRLHSQGSTWCYYLAERKWVAGGATNNGGNVLKWFRDVLEDGEVGYGDISELAAQSRPGANGLMFLPFLAGERSPHWNSDARGTLFGMSISHTKADIARAMKEGVAFQIYSVYRALTEISGVPEELRATGGLTKSPIWLQIFADIFGRPLDIPDFVEGSAFGAAALGLYATGKLKKLEEIQQLITIGRQVEPNMENHKLYQEIYELNRELYWMLSPFFRNYRQALQSKFN